MQLSDLRRRNLLQFAENNERRFARQSAVSGMKIGYWQQWRHFPVISWVITNQMVCGNMASKCNAFHFLDVKINTSYIQQYSRIDGFYQKRLIFPMMGNFNLYFIEVARDGSSRILTKPSQVKLFWLSKFQVETFFKYLNFKPHQAKLFKF